MQADGYSLDDKRTKLFKDDANARIIKLIYLRNFVHYLDLFLF